MTDSNVLEDQPIAWTPSPEVIERSRLMQFMGQVGVLTWDELYRYSLNDVEMFTAEVLRFLDIDFDPPYEKLLDTSEGIAFPKWCEGGGLNITEYCLDRWTDRGRPRPHLLDPDRGRPRPHLLDPDRGRPRPHLLSDEPAVIWEGEEGGTRTLTYAELLASVEACAERLCDLEIGKGDAVGIHLPMIPETVVALLAINRIGAIAVPVFSGYGIDAITSRMEAVGAKALFTCDGFPRRGKSVDMLTVAARAVANVPSIESVIVVERRSYVDGEEHEDHVAARERRRDEARRYEHLKLDLFSGRRVAIWGVGREGFSECDPKPPAKTLAEDPLIILYTSGTTGRPKGIAHTHASFPIKAAQDMAFGTDVGPGTRICWYTDIGWMMGPWLIYGALINGGTICIYDGAPDHQRPDRMWQFCAKHKVEILGISPTLIRALSACGDDLPKGHDLSSLRGFASTGEPWNPAPWWWLFEKVGNGRLPIINYSGGTEISGGILMGNLLLPQKPCSFPAPCPGMDVDILDEDGKSVGPGQVGELVIKQPWIGMARGFWEERERYLETYWSRFEDTWVHGDWAMRDKDGHWFILGRSDDTLKVGGKRVGPAEVESLLVAHPLVTEAAVIGVPDEIKGTAMVAFCVLRTADAPVCNEGKARKRTHSTSERKGWHYRGYLPHFDGEIAQFITFRLADSLPQKVVDRLRTELESGALDSTSEEYRNRVEALLDNGMGECILRRPDVAQIVKETLLNGDGTAYKLHAWVIMPNHAHVLLRALDGYTIPNTMQTIKSVSAHQINKLLGRKGRLWQPDYFDRYIRDIEHFENTVRYIISNPVDAGLCQEPSDWPFSSVSSAAEGPNEIGNGLPAPQRIGADRLADEGVRGPLEEELRDLVARDMGKPLTPSKIHFVSALPKTRNAKVMRRVIRSAYLGENAGDLSALEDPRTVKEIRQLGESTG